MNNLLTIPVHSFNPDLTQVGQDIYAALRPTKRKRVEFQTLHCLHYLPCLTGGLVRI